VLNWIWLGLILVAVLFGAWNGQMEAVQAAAFDSAKGAVNLVISMTGFMIFMLGLMQVARDGGLLEAHHSLGDDPERIRTAILAPGADVILVSGGSSVGREDYAPRLIAEIGELAIHGVAMRPSSPAGAGRIGDALVFLLPGNPVSTMVTYYQFVQPALRQMMGEQIHSPLQFKVPCSTTLKKTPGRMEFQRGILETDVKGETVVRSTGGQGSNILRSMSDANCFIILPAECGDVPVGTLVDVQPFAGL